MHSSQDWPELASLIDTLLDAPPEARDALIEALSAGDATAACGARGAARGVRARTGAPERPAGEALRRLARIGRSTFPTRCVSATA